MPSWSRRVFDLLLRAYPAAFRHEYERELRADVTRLWRDQQEAGSLSRL